MSVQGAPEMKIILTSSLMTLALMIVMTLRVTAFSLRTNCLLLRTREEAQLMAQNGARCETHETRRFNIMALLE